MDLLNQAGDLSSLEHAASRIERAGQQVNELEQ